MLRPPRTFSSPKGKATLSVTSRWPEGAVRPGEVEGALVALLLRAEARTGTKTDKGSSVCCSRRCWRTRNGASGSLEMEKAALVGELFPPQSPSLRRARAHRLRLRHDERDGHRRSHHPSCTLRPRIRACRPAPERGSRAARGEDKGGGKESDFVRHGCDGAKWGHACRWRRARPPPACLFVLREGG